MSPRIVKLLDISAPPFETIIKTLHNIAGEMGVEWEPKMVNEDNKDDIQAMGSVAVLAPGGAVVAPRSNVRGDDVEVCHMSREEESHTPSCCHSILKCIQLLFIRSFVIVHSFIRYY